MVESKTKNKQTLTLTATSEKEQAAKLAQVMASPSLNAARVQLAFNPNQGLDLMACRETLLNQITQLQEGDTTRIEGMLLAQAHSLQSMFTYYALQMQSAEYLNQFKVKAAIALKAQNQCRQTLAVLADIKNPKRAIFIKNQATNQQINMNSQPENSEINSPNQSNELLSEGSHATVDRRGEAEAITVNP